MKIITFRQIQRDKGKAVAAAIAANEPIQVDVRAYIVPASWLEIETNEPAIACSDLKSRMMQTATSASKSIPLRFGLSAETQAWLISLALWDTLNKPEAPSD